MRGVSESMAGRAAILQLLPFSIAEDDRVGLLTGGFPEALAGPKTRAIWFSSYIQTYLERDVRSVTTVRDLATFRRFLALVASRHGQMLNRSDIAAPLGVSVPTISEWLHVLELTGQIIVVPPYFENFGKRLVKSPKIYIGDSGLACHLLGIRTAAELERSVFLGSIFEGFVASELVKHQVNSGARREIYYFRDRKGLEVDFLVPSNEGGIWTIECRASKTVYPSDTRGLATLGQAIQSKPVRSVLVHRSSLTAPDSRVIAPDVVAVDVEGMLTLFG